MASEKITAMIDEIKALSVLELKDENSSPAVRGSRPPAGWTA